MSLLHSIGGKPATATAEAPADRLAALGVEPYVNTAEAGALLRKSPRTIQRYVNAGILPRPDLELPREWLWRKSTILAWQQSQAGKRRAGSR